MHHLVNPAKIHPLGRKRKYIQITAKLLNCVILGDFLSVNLPDIKC